MMTAIDWLEKRAQLSPDHIALIDRVDHLGKEINYTEFNAQANQTAWFLRENLHLQKGDIVAVLSSNCVQYLDVLFACNKLGTIMQNINWRLAVPELAQILNDAKPKVLIYSADFIDTVRKLRQRGDTSIERYVALNGKVQESDVAFNERNTFKTTTPGAAPIKPTDPWVLCYTGGTTGLPKAAIQTYENILANAVNTVVTWGLDNKDCAILNAPLFHTGGLNVFTTPLVYAGGTSIVCKSFNVDQTFDLLDEKRATVFFGVPTMFQMLQENPRWEKTDFDHLKLVISGGAPCPMTVYQKFWSKNVDFKSGFGMTEAGPNTFWLPKSMTKAKPGSVGFPLMHVEIKLINQHGMEIVEPNMVGELLIRGPHRTPGYRNNPTATAAAIDADGWLHSGDLAYRDEDGCYYIGGRQKEMYISGGENIYPLEVESALYTHPAVREAAVFGVHSSKWGEVGRAVISLKPGASVTEESLAAWMRDNVARYKIPHRIFITNELKKTAAGKISKAELRKEFGMLDPVDDRRHSTRDMDADRRQAA
jgi:fatty-acyl-CoA synthase